MMEEKRIPKEIIVGVVGGAVMAIALAILVTIGPEAMPNWLSFLPERNSQANIGTEEVPGVGQTTPDKVVSEQEQEDMQELYTNTIQGDYIAESDAKKEFHFGADGTYQGYFNEDVGMVSDAAYVMEYETGASVTITSGKKRQTYAVSFSDAWDFVLTDKESGKSFVLLQEFYK